MDKLAPFLRQRDLRSYHQPKNSRLRFKAAPEIRKRPPSNRLSSLYNLKNSLLRNLASYRLTSKFLESGLLVTDLNYTHNICPDHYICLPDLIGTCTDKNCLYQHKSNYIMTDIDKLADILSYKPSLTGFKPDSNLSQEENNYRCRIRLKQYSAKLIAKNSDKLVETIAQNLVKYVRANKSDDELLTLIRQLPKVRLTNGKASKANSQETKENQKLVKTQNYLK